MIRTCDFVAAPAAFFRLKTIKISGRDVYIDVEVDENEEASAVCNQKAGRSVSSFFSLFPSWYGNRRMLCIPVRIRLYAAVLYGESHSWIVRSCEAPWAISQTTALWYTCRSGKSFFPGVKPFDTPYYQIYGKRELRLKSLTHMRRQPIANNINGMGTVPIPYLVVVTVVTVSFVLDISDISWRSKCCGA